MPALHSFISNTRFRALLVGAALAAALGLAFTATPALAQWPTTCVELNDIVESHLGNSHNVGIYQRVFGAQAEQACQSDHRADVQATFAWAVGGAGAGALAPTAWPTTCVALNDIVEAHLGNAGNVGIYQKVHGAQAETYCRSDHRADVQSVFAWAIPTPTPTAVATPMAPPPPPPPPTSAPIGEILTLAASPSVFQDSTLWLGTSSGGVLRSTNAGAGFTQHLSGLPSPKVYDIAPSPTFLEDSIVIAATDVGIGYSTDRGVTWATAMGAPGVRTGGIAPSPRFQIDHTFYAIADNGVVSESTNGGASWSTVSANPGNGLPRDVNFDGLLTVQGRGDNIHIFTWISTNLWVSDDLGRVFRPVIGRSALPKGFRISSVAIHPAWHYDRVIWLGSDEHGIYRSEDGGETFHNVLHTSRGAKAIGRVTAIALSPNLPRDGTIVAATDRSKFFLSKRGQRQGTVRDIGAPGSWDSKGANLSVGSVRGLAFSNGFSGDETIYAAGGTRFAITSNSANDWYTYPHDVGPTS
ncbi:MAG: hypothetical protein OXG17_01910 [Chloroflexi bacterium]|nr:hypothetical protein [Chloroflexota bacterium]